jgi:hypothetical protein
MQHATTASVRLRRVDILNLGVQGPGGGRGELTFCGLQTVAPSSHFEGLVSTYRSGSSSGTGGHDAAWVSFGVSRREKPFHLTRLLKMTGETDYPAQSSTFQIVFLGCHMGVQ